MHKVWIWLLAGILLIVGAACLALGLNRSGQVVVSPLTGIRFSPDPATGYTVDPAPVPPLSLGYQLSFAQQSAQKIELSFSFPFAGKLWDVFYISPDGLVSFGSPQDEGLFHSGRLPAIAIHNIPFSLSPGGIFIAEGPGQVAVTWFKLRAAANPVDLPGSSPYTFQLILVADGTIVFRYYDLGLDSVPKAGGETPWIGVLTGRGLSAVDPLDLPVEKSFNSRAAGGLLDRFHAGQRSRTGWLAAAGIALAGSVLSAGFGILRVLRRGWTSSPLKKGPDLSP